MKKCAVSCLAVMFFASLCLAETNNVATSKSADVAQALTPIALTVTNVIPVSVSFKGDNGHVDRLERHIDIIEQRLTDCYEGLKAQVEKNVGDGVDKAGKVAQMAKEEAEEEYAKRYSELKGEQERFLDRLGKWLTILGFGVALLGIGLPLFNEWRAKRREEKAAKQVQTKLNQYEALKAELSKEMEVGRLENRNELLILKGESYFQLARIGFEQYKAAPNAQVLEIVVKQLSHCIECNVNARNGRGLKNAIAFLNTVMNKKPGKDLNHPERTPIPDEIVTHRIFVTNNLRTWNWNIKIEDVQDALREGGIDGDDYKYSVANLDTVMRKCGEYSGDIS